MSFAEKVAVLKAVNKAYAVADAASGSVRAERVQQRKILRLAQENEIILMKMEDVQSYAIRDFHLKKEEARRRSIQSKKDEARLLRELAARLDDDEASNLNETFLQRETRLRDRDRLRLKDAVSDCKEQAFSMDESQM